MLSTADASRTFILVADGGDGYPVYYTGRAGQAWVSSALHRAFGMGEGEADHTARLFNGRTVLHRLHFRVVSLADAQADERDQYGEG